VTLVDDPCLGDDHRRLRDLISEVSQLAYHAGWMNDAEFHVWRLATEGGEWGRTSAEEARSQLADALNLARLVDGSYGRTDVNATTRPSLWLTGRTASRLGPHVTFSNAD
jgi:hypothetical protein